MRTTLVLITLGLMTAACATTSKVSDRNVEIIALCSGGMTLSDEVKFNLKAQLDSITPEMDVGAAIESAVKGIDFNKQDLTNENVGEVHKTYAQCIKDLYLR